ncbi:hypothetical protein HDV05_007822 [Chytridiales sp. JEL 0842]|nr:hypothetical protein HDV05_007822 [Chytridiales sp. JEL 0842]
MDGLATLDERIQQADSPEKKEQVVFQWLASLEKELLQIPAESVKETLKTTQSNLEKALVKQISSQSPKATRPLRQLISRIFIILYSRGETRSLFDTVVAIQGILNAKKPEDVSVRIAATYCLGCVMEQFGNQVLSLFGETANIFLKALRYAKEPEIALRRESLVALARTLRGAGKAASDSVIKDITKLARNSLTDKSQIIRASGSELLECLFSYTALPKPQKNDEFETLLIPVVKALDGASYVTRRSVSSYIGKVLSHSQTISAQPASKKGGVDTSHKQHDTILTVHDMLMLLKSHFIRATSRDVRVGIFECYAATFQSLGGTFVDSNFAAIVKFFAEFVCDAKLIPTEFDILLMRELGTFIVRDVLFKMLSEQGQIRAFKDLVEHWIVTEVKAGGMELSTIFVYHELSFIIDELGSAISSAEESFSDRLPFLIGQSSYKLAIASAKLLRSFCTAMPSILPDIIDRLTTLLQRDLLTLSSENLAKYIAHGNDLAAVITIATKHPLKVSFEGLAVIFGLSTQLLKSASTTKDAKISLGQIQVAWTLIGSLMTVGTGFVSVHISQILLIWKSVFVKPTSKDVPKSEQELLSALSSKYAALSALNSFLSFNSGSLTTIDVAKRIVVCLNNALQYLGMVSAAVLPSTTLTGAALLQNQTLKAKISEMENLYRKRLFNCYNLIKPESCFETILEQLVSTTIESFAPNPDLYVEKVGSQQDKPQDNYALSTFVAEVRAAQTDRDCIGLLSLQDIDAQRAERMITCNNISNIENDSHDLYFAQKADTFFPTSSVAAIDASITLFASVFALQAPAQQEVNLETLAKAIKCSIPKVPASRKSALQLNILMALIMMLKSMALRNASIKNAKAIEIIRSMVTLLSSDVHEAASWSQGFGRLGGLGLFPMLGKILHAVLGSIGPELQSLSRVRDLCFSIFDDLRNDSDPFVVVEAIQCIQQFINFAPKHVDTKILIPFLQSHLYKTDQHQLLLIRKASITCLYQLTQRDPHVVLDVTEGADLEQQLFKLLDLETDSVSRDEIKDIQMNLLKAVAQQKPSRWVEICKEILATNAGHSSGSSNQANNAMAVATEEEDEGDVKDQKVQAPVSKVVNLQPHWRTQVFAVRCLRRLVSLCVADGSMEHTNLKVAREKKELSGNLAVDCLVFRLSDMVRMAFNAATASVQDLQLEGLFLLQEIVQHFSKSTDPDIDDQYLLEQYQAQIAAALTPALTSNSSALVKDTACRTCAAYISSGLYKESAATGRLWRLLIAMFESGGAPNASPLEQTVLKLSVATSWAEIFLASTLQFTFLVPYVKPYLNQLFDQWLLLLKEYAIIKSDKELLSHVNRSDDGASGGSADIYRVSAKDLLLPFFQRSWLFLVQAVASLNLAEIEQIGKVDAFKAHKFIILGLCTEGCLVLPYGSLHIKNMPRMNLRYSVAVNTPKMTDEDIISAACLWTLESLFTTHPDVWTANKDVRNTIHYAQILSNIVPKYVKQEIIAALDRILQTDNTVLKLMVMKVLLAVLKSNDKNDGPASSVSPSMPDIVLSKTRLLSNIIMGYIPQLSSNISYSIFSRSALTQDDISLLLQSLDAMLLLSTGENYAIAKDTVVPIAIFIITNILCLEKFSGAVGNKATVSLNLIVKSLPSDFAEASCLQGAFQTLLETLNNNLFETEIDEMNFEYLQPLSLALVILLTSSATNLPSDLIEIFGASLGSMLTHNLEQIVNIGIICTKNLFASQMRKNDNSLATLFRITFPIIISTIISTATSGKDLTLFGDRLAVLTLFLSQSNVLGDGLLVTGTIIFLVDSLEAATGEVQRNQVASTLLNLAASHSQTFKQAIASLPMEKRQLLETTLKQLMAQAATSNKTATSNQTISDPVDGVIPKIKLMSFAS